MKRFSYIHTLHILKHRTHEHSYTHQCGFSIQTNGRRVGQSCAVTTTDLCNDMKINTCGETVPDSAGQALMRAILKTATQCFPFESSFFFLAFSLHVWSQRGWTEDGRSKRGKGSQQETYFTDGKHSSPLLFTKGYCRSKRLPAYTLSLCGCCGAVQGDADDYNTLYY